MTILGKWLESRHGDASWVAVKMPLLELRKPCGSQSACVTRVSTGDMLKTAMMGA